MITVEFDGIPASSGEIMPYLYDKLSADNAVDLGNELMVEATVYLEPPKSWTKARRMAAMSDDSHVTKSDWKLGHSLHDFLLNVVNNTLWRSVKVEDFILSVRYADHRKITIAFSPYDAEQVRS